MDDVVVVGVGDSNNINGIVEDEDDYKKSSTKGKGLKKWKRIQRTAMLASAATTPAEDDLHRFLKRDSRRGGGGGDSDNSEDPSSKSSTAASAPKFRYHHHHRNRTAPPKKPSASYSQSPRSNTNIETSKKLRGGGGGGSGFKIDNDKDVSYSSVESDLRSSNFLFTEITNNGGRDVDNASEAQASDQQSNDYFKGNGDDEEEDDDEVSQDHPATLHASSWEANQLPLPSRDLLSESIISLHAVHQALEKEIQSFGEIGKEAIVLKEEEEVSPAAAPVYEHESKGKLESRVAELEKELLGIKEEGEESKWREVEQLFKHKVEAEVQCLTLREKMKTLVVSKAQYKEEDDPLKLRTTASMYGIFFSVQLFFLFLAFRLLLLQLWPGSTGFVPT